MIKISYRNDVRSVCHLLTYEKLLELMQDAKTEYNIDKFRELTACGDKERAQQYKILGPMAVWQGCVPDGEMPKNGNVTLNGLYATDWDHVAQGDGSMAQGAVSSSKVSSSKVSGSNGSNGSNEGLVYSSAKELAEIIASRAEELGLLMVHVTPSGDGVRCVGLCRPEFETIQENQRWLSEQFGLKNDEVTCNVGRTWFLPKWEDVVYIDGNMFEKDILKVPSSGGTSANNTAAVNHVTGVVQDCSCETCSAALAQSLKAFDLCVKRVGLDPSTMDVWGEHNWHNNLMAVLSLGVGKLMSKEQLLAVVSERLPNYSQTADCKALIDYFYEKYSADKGYMAEALRAINAESQKPTQTIPEGGVFDTTGSDVVVTDDGSQSPFPSVGGEGGEAPSYSLTAPPQMPPGIQEFVDACPTVPQKAAAAMIALMAYSVLLTHLRCRIQGTSLEIVSNLLCYLWGDSSAGKTTLSRWILNTILGTPEDKTLDTLYGMDNMFMDYWVRMGKKHEGVGNGAKKTVVANDYPMRMISLDMTSPGLMKHFMDAKGLHSLLFVADHDMLVANSGLTAWRKVDSDLRTMYDGEWLSKKTATLSGLSGRARALGCCLICGTEVDLNQYYLGKGMQIFKGLGNRTCFLHLKPQYLNRQWPRSLTPSELAVVKNMAKKALNETVRVTESYDEEGEVAYQVDQLPLLELDLDWLWNYLGEEFEAKHTVDFLLDSRESSVSILARCKEVGSRSGMVFDWLWGCRNDEETRELIRNACMWVSETMKNGILEIFQEQMEKPSISLKLAIPQASVWDQTPDEFDTQMLQKVMDRLGRTSQVPVVINRWKTLPIKGTDEVGVIEKIGKLYYKKGTAAHQKALAELEQQEE